MRATFVCIFILATIAASVSAAVSTVPAYAEPLAGVKQGDWIEYAFSITGPPLNDTMRNITWYRTEVLAVDGASLRVNKTALTVNGILFSSIWDFNFREGQVQGWAIIPANLSAGDAFFDVAKSANVTIEGEEQKTLLGGPRAITHATDPGKVYKEWDKATGVYVHAVEHTTDYTITTNAVATNMWGPQTRDGNQQMLYGILAAGTLVAGSLVVIAQRKGLKQPTLFRLSQGKIAVLSVFAVAIAEIAFMFFFPFSSVGLSFAQINLIMQTIWTALVIGSIWLRAKGNYFAHEVTMLVVITAWAVGLTAVLFMGPFGSSTEIFSNTLIRLVMNALHGIFSVPALVFGVWLVFLWRPYSQSFAAKSRRIAQLIPFFWMASYVVGILDFLALHTAFFG